jgi:hypothetical protein
MEKPKEIEVYSFNPITKEYTGIVIADESPLEVGVYLLPANSTTEKPPKQSDQYIIIWDGKKWQKEKIKEKPEEDRIDNSPNQVRAIRNSLLAETDWTQLNDSPLKLNEGWVSYRQLLRDIPKQEGFPNNIVWPTKPI